VKNVGRITRTSHLVGFALLLAGCADHQPTSPNVAPTLGPAAVGSIIKSSVVTATTLCRPSGECSTSTRYSEISEKVGSTSTLRAAMGISFWGGEQSSGPKLRTDKQLSPDAPKKLHVSGRTLYGDAVNNDGSASHIEVTGDAVAKGKLSGVRLFRDGKPLIAVNARWKDVGGVSYREHSDVTVYSEGRVAMHEEKEFSPIAVLPGDASDRSPGTLTLSSTYVFYGRGGCPFGGDVCRWMQSYSPQSAFNSLWTSMANIGYDVANWWNSVWGGGGSDTSAEIAETTLLAMEAFAEPGWVSLSLALLSAGGGGLTDTLITAIAVDMEDFLIGLLFL